MSVTFPKDWEYAGFMYRLTSPEPHRVIATPHEGQHPAANKEKHRRAAVETFLEEHKS